LVVEPACCTVMDRAAVSPSICLPSTVRMSTVAAFEWKTARRRIGRVERRSISIVYSRYGWQCCCSFNNSCMPIIVLFLLFFAERAFSQLQPAPPQSVGMSAPALDRAAGVLDAEVQSGKLGPAGILVARGGKLVLHKGFGKRSPQANVADVQPASFFLLASIPKPLTAAALMLLVDRGLISVAEPV